jgi:hypothetical protein
VNCSDIVNYRMSTIISSRSQTVTGNYLNHWDLKLSSNLVGLCFLLDNSPASEFYIPTFRKTLSVPSSYLPTYEDGTDSVFRNKIQTPGNYPEESIQHSEHGESLK